MCSNFNNMDTTQVHSIAQRFVRKEIDIECSVNIVMYKYKLQTYILSDLEIMKYIVDGSKNMKWQ